MHFLRFASSIPGSYWGCCACDIIQNFNVDPDAKSSIQLVSGDGGGPIGGKFAGKTYREIFWQRLRYGTFGDTNMPSHGFIAIITQGQINGTYGKLWLGILKEAGFEFIRTISNSVYAGAQTFDGEKAANNDDDDWYDDDCDEEGTDNGYALNYVFALFRNVGHGNVVDQFTPPKEWTDMPSVVTEPWTLLDKRKELTDTIRNEQLPLYKKLPEGVFFTEEELVKEGVPVIYAGKRSMYPEQPKEVRARIEATDKNLVKATVAAAGPWTAAKPAG